MRMYIEKKWRVGKNILKKKIVMFNRLDSRSGQEIYKESMGN